MAYAIVDVVKGVVLGVVSQDNAKNPIEACKYLDELLGVYNREYIERSARPNVNKYFVHVVPDFFFVDDGTSRSTIERALSFPLIAVVSAFDQTED